MNDEILDLNIEITGFINLLYFNKEEIPDVRDLKNKDDEYSAWSKLDDLKDKLEEAIDLINELNEFEYN